MIRPTSFLVLSALAAVSLFTPVLAQEDLSKKEKPAAALKVGDPAPALKVTRWLRGDAVRTFVPGKIYVVEFWASWCGALHLFMPQLADCKPGTRTRA
jgi:thiol-disulfide isomerase/thioredoxin